MRLGSGLGKLRMRLEYEEGAWLKTADAYSRTIAMTGTNAVRTTGRKARDNARRNIAASGLGDIWERSLQMKFFPKHGIAIDPEVYIFSKINYASVFEKGATISPKKNYIWLPLPSVPAVHGQGLKFGGIVARLHMTPRQYVAKIGPLVTIKRPGKPPMLGAVVIVPRKAQPWGSFVTRGRLKRGEAGKRGVRQVIPLYVAVDEVTLRKRTDMEGAVASAAEKLPDILASEFDTLARAL